MRGLLQLLAGCRTQMCQYHHLRIVQRYLARKPELPASIDAAVNSQHNY